jgi:hypothetical protein
LKIEREKKASETINNFLTVLYQVLFAAASFSFFSNFSDLFQFKNICFNGKTFPSVEHRSAEITMRVAASRLNQMMMNYGSFLLSFSLPASSAPFIRV